MGFLTPKVQTPAARDYAKETRDTLQAQIDLAPQFYEAEASEAYGQPAYTRLGLRTLEDAMTGGGGSKGLLRLYREDITPQMAYTEAEANRIGRESALADVERYGGRATEALLGADPMKKELSDVMMQRQLEIAQSPDILDPQLRREFQQSYRGGLGARGMAYSPYTVPQEAGFTALQAEQIRRGRVQQQQQVLAQRQQLAGDPFLQILGRPGQAFGAAQGMGGQGFGVAQTAPRLFSPESQYGADLAAGNQASLLASRSAQAQARAGIMSGLFQGLGSIGGGIAAGKCHVAREVYGEDNPKWLQFFFWKELDGPTWFRDLYNKHSEKWAEFIRNKPRLKGLIRRWMDSKIEGE